MTRCPPPSHLFNENMLTSSSAVPSMVNDVTGRHLFVGKLGTTRQVVNGFQFRCTSLPWPKIRRGKTSSTWPSTGTRRGPPIPCDLGNWPLRLKPVRVLRLLNFGPMELGGVSKESLNGRLSVRFHFNANHTWAFLRSVLRNPQRKPASNSASKMQNSSTRKAPYAFLGGVDNRRGKNIGPHNQTTHKHYLKLQLHACG